MENKSNRTIDWLTQQDQPSGSARSTMSQKTAINTQATRRESVLACTNCAKCKAKCDRKVPCTRCVSKKLDCQLRIPQRGSGRSAFVNDSPVLQTVELAAAVSVPDPTISRHDSASDLAVSNSAVSSSSGEQGGGGIYMDWSNPAGHRFKAPTREESPNDTDTSLHHDDSPALAAATAAINEILATASLPHSSAHNSISSGGEMFRMSSVGSMAPNPMDFVSNTSLSTPSIRQPFETPDLNLWDLTMDGLMPDITVDFGNPGTEMPGIIPEMIHSSITDALAIDPPVDNHQIPTLDGWSSFQCNPVAAGYTPPLMAAHNIESLSNLLKHGHLGPEKFRLIESDVEIEPLLPSTRSELVAVLQGLLYEAQQFYGLQKRTNGGIDWVGMFALELPPAATLESLFRAYVASSEPYYPFISNAFLETNARNSQTSTFLHSMLILLMMAAGAMISGAREPHGQLGLGLLEICRVSLRNRIEQNPKLASRIEALQCSLLLTITSAWSGDKWQMDAATYQKSMFLEMHLKATPHDSRSTQLAKLDSCTSKSQQWRLWKEFEYANRLTYSWLILDLEICLFQDVLSNSYLPISNLDRPLPSSRPAWIASSVEQWVQSTTGSRREDAILPWSLNNWVRWFTETHDPTTPPAQLSPIILRLLLCYLHNQVIQLRLAMDIITNRQQRGRTSRHSSTVLLSVQVQEIQDLLHRWYDLARSYRMVDAESPAAMAINMVLYHLLMLNTLASFPLIERTAREGFGDQDLSCSPSSMIGRGSRPYHLEHPREVLVHCGQVMRFLAIVSEIARPLWYAAAAYRATLTAWACSMAQNVTDVAVVGRHAVLLNVQPAEHPSLVAYLNHEGGTPVISEVDGSMTYVDTDPIGVLRFGVRFLEVSTKCQLVLGVQQKLTTMAQRMETLRA